MVQNELKEQNDTFPFHRLSDRVENKYILNDLLYSNAFWSINYVKKFRGNVI